MGAVVQVGGGPGGDALIAEVIGRVDLRRLTDDAVTAFAMRWPVYRDLPSEALWGPVWDATHVWFGVLARQLQGGGGATDQELERIRTAGRDEAAFGIRIDDMMRAVSLGGTLAWETIIDAATPSEVVQLAAAVPRIFAMFGAISTRVAAYVADGHQEQASHERVARRLYAEAVRGRVDADGLRDLGVVLGPRVRAFELVLPGRAPWEHGMVASALRDQGILAVTRNDRLTGVLDAEAPDDPFPGPPAILAVSAPHEPQDLPVAVESIAGLTDAALQAGRAGRLGPDDLMMERLLFANPHLAQVVAARVVVPLSGRAEARSANLLQTLVTFLACDLDRRQASRALELHPSTLAYRLGRITELTGLRFDRADDLALLSLAAVGLRSGDGR